MVFGAWAAAWPLIRTDLDLSYIEVGILVSVPHIFGCLVEPPLGLLGDVWNRRVLVRAGGVAFLVSLAAIAMSSGFLPLLLALMLVSPASGAFVSLSQATLMDLDPNRHQQNMARWALAGSIGVLTGPLVLAGVSALGLGWRGVFVAFAWVAAVLLAATWRLPLTTPSHGAHPLRAFRRAVGDALQALRRRDVVRWLTLLEFSDLMLDVLHGFLALYFVDAVGSSGAGAAVAIVIWTGVGLLGDLLLIPLLERVDGLRYLRLSAAATLILFPAFLLVGWIPGKLAVLGLLGMSNAGWYAILKGRLYSAMPGRSATVMALGSLFGTVGGIVPLLVGLVAHAWGLRIAMWLLLAAPVALLIGLPRGGRAPRTA